MALSEQLDQLAAFEPTPLPVISLYLNTQADQHGRDNFDSFVRKEFKERAQTYPLRSPERVSFDRDAERITAYLADELRPSANGLAIFACAGANDFFVPVELDAPIAEHRLYVYHQPHLYPLARLNDQYPRYAALLVDTNSARLFVFGIGERQRKERVQNPNVSRTSVGGWSQARYQRHIRNHHLHHAKEVADVLERVVHEEDIQQVIIAGDEVIIPTLLRQFPQHLADRVIDIIRLDMTTPEYEVLETTLAVLREQDAQDDAAKVERLLDAYRADGLGVIGAHDTLLALANGQVDEVLVSAALEEIHDSVEDVGAALAPGAPLDDPSGDTATRTVKVADELVTQARQTGATVTFIEDESLLADVGGVGALLRYRL